MPALSGVTSAKPYCARGNDVVCLDNYYTGSKANILHLRENPHFELLRHDIINPIVLEVDQIYNLACPASPIHYQFNPVKTVKTNVIGTLNMLGLAKRVKARILQASTSEVYGDPAVHPQKETYRGNVNCIGPRACYDEGKRVAETLMMDYHRQHRVDIRVVRIFNTYGPEDGPGRWPGGQQFDHPGPARGTAHGLRRWAADPFFLLYFGYGPGSEGDDGAGDLSRSSQPGQPPGIHYFVPGRKSEGHDRLKLGGYLNPLPQDDPVQRKPDISLAKKYLKWKPRVEVDEGLRQTIDYFRSQIS